ncbi:hypothetical protein QQS21_006470 [Conoideocrella luteorostrata]|uniref:Glucose-methanol-choline oxidoreductase C-terminal domain-containing protein n=1 Tax=Conoideocrella luteorostrata TaxID=1105319 RepID=A0AAJ0CMX9_9HYPO|nr:hypothetical protein QQS21_006470 [Conoideocrella luteorostrata]
MSSGLVFSANSSVSNESALDKETNPTFSLDDDDAIKQWMRQTVATRFHLLGTCKMAAESNFGVVDNELNVYGVKGLKIADLSMAPGIVAVNTMNTAVILSEKAADIIIREL